MIWLGQWILQRRVERSEQFFGEPRSTLCEVTDRIVRTANDSDMLFLTSDDPHSLR